MGDAGFIIKSVLFVDRQPEFLSGHGFFGRLSNFIKVLVAQCMLRCHSFFWVENKDLLKDVPEVDVYFLVL